MKAQIRQEKTKDDNKLWELAAVNTHNCFPLSVSNCPRFGTAKVQGLGALCAEKIHSKLNTALLHELTTVFCFSHFFFESV